MIDVLKRIHKKGIVYNNIAPKKVLISRDPKDLKLYVIDFKLEHRFSSFFSPYQLQNERFLDLILNFAPFLNGLTAEYLFVNKV